MKDFNFSPFRPLHHFKCAVSSFCHRNWLIGTIHTALEPVESTILNQVKRLEKGIYFGVHPLLRGCQNVLDALESVVLNETRHTWHWLFFLSVFFLLGQTDNVFAMDRGNITLNYPQKCFLFGLSYQVPLAWECDHGVLPWRNASLQFAKKMTVNRSFLLARNNHSTQWCKMLCVLFSVLFLMNYFFCF